ncbi:MAG: alpha/beta fold hydrolase [Anaerolineae bacterium]|nr:alpha/beta fold hydrolase [Anaerolineae bacterium]
MKKHVYVLGGGALLVLLILVGVYVDQNNIPLPGLWMPKTIDLTTQDGLSLKATFYPAKGAAPVAPALLLLHAAYSDRSAWHSFAQAAQDAGYAVLALDSRGHGESTGEKVFDPAMDMDVDVALAWLIARSDVVQGRVGVAGASVGANLALRAGVRHPEIKSVALLSPGMQLWDIDIQEAIIDYGQRPVLIVVAEEDAYPAGSCQQLDAMALGEHRLHVYTGVAHGTDMFQAHDDLTSMLLEWFDATLQ